MEISAEVLQVQREVLNDTGLEKLLAQTDAERVAAKEEQLRQERLARLRAQQTTKKRRGYRPYPGANATRDSTLNKTTDATLNKTGPPQRPPPRSDSLLGSSTTEQSSRILDQLLGQIPPMNPRAATSEEPEAGLGPTTATDNTTPPGQQQQRDTQQQQQQRPQDNVQGNDHDNAHDNVQQQVDQEALSGRQDLPQHPGARRRDPLFKGPPPVNPFPRQQQDQDQQADGNGRHLRSRTRLTGIAPQYNPLQDVRRPKGKRKGKSTNNSPSGSVADNQTDNRRPPAQEQGNQAAGGPHGAQQQQPRHKTPPPAVRDPQVLTHRNLERNGQLTSRRRWRAEQECRSWRSTRRASLPRPRR
jgi:hypothetical protein